MTSRLGLVLLCLWGYLNTSAAAEATRSPSDQALAAMEWVDELPPQLASCTYLTKFDLQRRQRPLPGLSVHALACQGSTLLVMTKLTESGSNRVLDAKTLPRLKRGERLIYPGSCELDGNSDTDFFAVVRFGRRESADWQYGVRAAWVPDPDSGRIQPLSTRHIVCWRPTPP